MKLLFTVLAAAATTIACGPQYRLNMLEQRLVSASDRHDHRLAEHLAEELVERTHEKSGPISLEYRDALRKQAHVLAENDRGQLALDTMQKSLELDVAFFGSGDYRLEQGYYELATIQFGLEQREAAKRSIDTAVELCNHISDADRSTFVCGLMSEYGFSRHYRQLGLYERAEALLLSSEARPFMPTPVTFEISGLSMLGDFYFEYGDLGKALWYYEKSRKLWQAAVPPAEVGEHEVYRARGGDISMSVVDTAHDFHSIAPRSLERLISVTDRLGRFGDSSRLRSEETDRWLDAPEAQLTIRRRIDFEMDTWRSPYRLALQWQALGFYRWKRGLLGQAIESYETAMRWAEKEWEKHSIYERHFPYEDLLDGRLVLGDLYTAAARFSDAEAQYRLFLDEVDRYFNVRHRWRLDGRARLAMLHHASGDHGHALAAWNEYLRLAEQVRGKEHAEYAWGLHNLAETKDALGESAEARRLRARARILWDEYAKAVAAVDDLPLPATLKPYEALIK
ncbi:MAG TPA: tetratricopeptide repeat protein [Candidatus Limnocylindrales bacterium]|nr:tetratricopeptide repeat protein [Candidatus Limnocylindrales bacterium]